MLLVIALTLHKHVLSEAIGWAGCASQCREDKENPHPTSPVNTGYIGPCKRADQYTCLLRSM